MRRVQGLYLTFGLLGTGLLAGCDEAPRESYVEPGATTRVSQGEIPGRQSPSDLSPITAQRYVDEVRLGRGLDPEGQVPRDLVSQTFASGSPIYLSMEVTDAPAGSLIQASLLDAATAEKVWSAQKSVPAGQSYLSFKVDDSLPRGSYRAQLIIGDETVALREFEVIEEQG
jgi:hypothetical protein